MATVADLIADCLHAEGVSVVFGLPGEENTRIIQAISDRPDIRFILVHHEQAASFMADVYGRLTGRAGVCLATLGPGAINLLLGAADATTDSAPVVAISAQVGLDRIYKESHQVVALTDMFAPVTKWSDTVASAQAVPEMMRKAFDLAQAERPGATYLAVPEDVEAQVAPADLGPLHGRPGHRAAADLSQVWEAIDLLSHAKSRSSWPVTASCVTTPARSCGDSPRPSIFRWRPPSRPRERCPTPTPMLWVWWASCATTTRTSPSTTPTSSSRWAMSSRSSHPRASIPAMTRTSSTSTVSLRTSMTPIRSRSASSRTSPAPWTP